MNLRNNPIFRLFRFVNTYFGKYRLTIALIAVLSFVGSLLEGIGINAIIPMFSFINAGPSQPTDLVSQTIQSAFLFFHASYTLKNIFILIVCMFLIKTVVLFISQYITISTQVTYERDARNELMRLTLESDWAYLSKQKLGHLEQTLIMSVEQGSKFLIHTSNLLLVAASLLVYSFLAVNISVIITILTLMFGMVVFYAIRPLFRRNRAASGLTLKEYKHLAHSINENILGLKTIKAGFVERQIMRKTADSFETLRRLRMKVGLLAAFTTALMQPLPLFFILGIFAVFYKTGAFTLASFAVVVYAINKVFNGFQSLQSEIHTMTSSLPYLTSAAQYREEAMRYKEETRGEKPFVFTDRLDFKHVSFGYEGGVPVVSDVTFTLKKGELLGLIGPSGAGKTTLVDLFLRLLRPREGSILLDGVDVLEIDLAKWRTNVGYVSQDIFLADDTMANNIRFYGDAVTDDDIKEAARLANIYDFIMEQPDGFDTIVGERGMKLSGGQRQRIALARVLARRPQILILDEATSALDNESEILVQKAIEGLRGKITVVAIAHRLSTVIDSDRLIVLEKGRIVEEGPPQKLLQDENSYFSKVYNLKR